MRSLRAMRSKASTVVERGFASEHLAFWCRELDRKNEHSTSSGRHNRSFTGNWGSASSRELSRPPCTRPKSIRSLPRSIRWVAWEKYRKSWMQYCISTRRVSSLAKFFTSMEDRRPVTTRTESFRGVLITPILQYPPPFAPKPPERPPHQTH